MNRVNVLTGTLALMGCLVSILSLMQKNPTISRNSISPLYRQILSMPFHELSGERSYLADSNNDFVVLLRMLYIV